MSNIRRIEETTCPDTASCGSTVAQAPDPHSGQSPCVSHMWHVTRLVSGVRGATRAEIVAVRNLSAEGWRVHLPLFVEWRKSRDGKRDVDDIKPLFPGYAFVQPKPSDPWCGGITSAIIGVRDVLRNATGRPLSVPGRIVQALMDQGRPGDGLIDERYAGPVFIASDSPVRIRSGPFADIHGICKQSSATRVTLLIAALGAEHTVTLPRAQVEVL